MKSTQENVGRLYQGNPTMVDFIGQNREVVMYFLCFWLGVRITYWAFVSDGDAKKGE